MREIKFQSVLQIWVKLESSNGNLLQHIMSFQHKISDSKITNKTVSGRVTGSFVRTEMLSYAGGVSGYP